MVTIELVENFQITSAALIAGVTSLLIAVVIMLTQFWHGKFTVDDVQGVQKIHKTQIPRIGGLAIYLACFTAYVYTQSPFQKALGITLLTALPAFMFGFAEDLTRRVSVAKRLIATLVSGFFGIYLTGYTLTGLDIWLIDTVFESIPVVSYLFTIIAVAGIANAFNVVDGNNGLASGLGMIGLLGLLLLTYHCGDPELLWVISVILCAVAGFFIINWPWGRLFLGDGGSYLIGFLFAWIAVMLVERNEDISPFCILLLVAYPFTEVCYTIYRRLNAGRKISDPDALHFHSLLQKFLQLRTSGTPLQTNSLTGSLIVGAHAALLPLVLYIHEWLWACLALLLVYVLVYLKLYAYLRQVVPPCPFSSATSVPKPGSDSSVTTNINGSGLSSD